MSIEHGRPTDAGRAAQRRERLLTWPQLVALVPYSRQHIGRLEASGHFPKRLQLGPGRVAWRETEIHAWLDKRERGALQPWRRSERRPTGSPSGRA